MKQPNDIVSLLPYGPDFKFVDQIEEVSEEGISGYYTFPETASYLDSHFPGNPVVPGVLLTECMAQIGLVGLGVFLSISSGKASPVPFVFTESNVNYLQKVLPGQRVKVSSQKVYYRLGKLKCKVSMYDEQEEKICYGTMAGMIIKPKA